MTYYHGTKKDSAYFEGWYLKHQQGNDTIALIPAVHMDGKGDTSASIQVVTQQGAHAFRFPLSAFSALPPPLPQRLFFRNFNAHPSAQRRAGRSAHFPGGRYAP